MPERETRFEVLRNIMSKKIGKIPEREQNVDKYMGNEYSRVQLGYSIDIITNQKVACACTCALTYPDIHDIY